MSSDKIAKKSAFTPFRFSSVFLAVHVVDAMLVALDGFLMALDLLLVEVDLIVQVLLQLAQLRLLLHFFNKKINSIALLAISFFFFMFLVLKLLF